jgi:hypothetical protein
MVYRGKGYFSNNRFLGSLKKKHRRREIRGVAASDRVDVKSGQQQ